MLPAIVSRVVPVTGWGFLLSGMSGFMVYVQVKEFINHERRLQRLFL